MGVILWKVTLFSLRNIEYFFKPVTLRFCTWSLWNTNRCFDMKCCLIEYVEKMLSWFFFFLNYRTSLRLMCWTWIGAMFLLFSFLFLDNGHICQASHRINVLLNHLGKCFCGPFLWSLSHSILGLEHQFNSDSYSHNNADT